MLERAKNLGKAMVAHANPPPSEKDAAMSEQHHAKRALKGWRIIMDKVITMLVLVEHQHIVEGWLPLSQPSLGLPSESKEERLEDVYAELIQCTKRLMPLRSKEEPKVSMSTCIHPKKELRGGGNQAGSYIYCRLCHSRWENTMRSQEMRKEIKEQNAKKKGGLLSQETQAQQAPHTMKNAEEHSTASLVEGLRSAIQEEQAKTERMRSMMQKEMEAQRIASQEAQLRNERMIQSLLQSRQGPEVIPEEMAVVKCLCGAEAEKLRVKREGPRQGRFFWKCVQRRCEFFKWDNQTDATSTMGSFSIVGSSEASAVAPRRRSKSPRRSMSDTAGGAAIMIPDSD